MRSIGCRRQVLVHSREQVIQCKLITFAARRAESELMKLTPGRKIVLVADNLNILHHACLYERLASPEARCLAEKIEWHYTPEHVSWLNIVQCEISVLKRQCLRRSRLPDIQTVSDRVTAWELVRNQHHNCIDWRFTNEDARIKLKRLYPIVNVQ